MPSHRTPDADRWQRLEALLRPVHDRAVRTARALAGSPDDGDDLYQEACLRAWDRLDDLREAPRFPGWFYAVLLSLHRSRARRKFWRRFLSLEREAGPGFDPPGEDARERQAQRRQAERAIRALATLPAVQREAVILFEMEGFSIEEIAEIQKVSISAVKSRLSRGRSRIRRRYEQLGDSLSRTASPPRPGREGNARAVTEGGAP